MTIRQALLRGSRRPRVRGAGTPLYRGDGYEFAEVRAYAAGDDLGRIDWAATARSGALQTRIVADEIALTIAAILDTSASMNVGKERPVACAASEALRAWFHAAQPQDRRISIGHARDESFCLAASLRRARRVLRRGSALLVISDWHDLPTLARRELVQFGARYDCTALIVRDPWYDDLPIAGIVHVRGAEGGRRRLYVGSRERRNYREATARREETAIAQFAAAGWRAGLLREADGAASLAAAFGVRP